MRILAMAAFWLPVYVPHLQHAIGIGTDKFIPINTLDIQGNASIGEAYSGVVNAPPNGIAVQGKVGIGTSSPISKLHVIGSFTCTDSLQLPGAEWAGFLKRPDTDLQLQGKGILKLGTSAFPEQLQFSLDSGHIFAKGYLQSERLAGNGLRPLGADPSGVIRPMQTGLSLPNSQWISGVSETTPVAVQVFYGQQGLFSSWVLRNSAGQIVASGDPGPNNAMNFQETLSLPPGNYLMQAYHSNQLSWVDGWFRIFFPGGGLGPVIPGTGVNAWGVSIPEIPKTTPTSTSRESQHIIRGRVSLAGNPLSGGGYSVLHYSTGRYTISFAESLADIPTVLVSPESASPVFPVLENVSNSQFDLRTVNESGQPVNATFHFWISGNSD